MHQAQVDSADEKSDAPEDELEAVIREARRRTRRRRAAGAVVASVGLAGGVWLGLSGDASEPNAAPISPREIIERAAERTVDEPTVAVGFEVDGPGEDWSGEGMIELAEGRSRVEATAPTSTPRSWTVVGTNGEGEGTTYMEDPAFGARQAGECWFDPWWPVGFFGGTTSIEQSTRLTGAVSESLAAGEIEAVGGDAGTYEVGLAPSAEVPRNDFKPGPRRTWGDRDLIGRLTGPIEVAVGDDGTLTGLRMSVDSGGPPPSAARRAGEGRPGSIITASFEPASSPLVLDRPRCLAIE